MVVAAVIAFVAVISLAACGRRGEASGASGREDATPQEDADVARARAVVERRAPLPDRVETLAMIESIQARAVHEGSGPRGQVLYALGAQLFERLWRVEGQDRDAEEAMNLYRGASRDLGGAGACDAALAAGRLAGDYPRDPRASYAELYRTKRRLARAQHVVAGAPPAPSALPALPAFPVLAVLASCERAVDDALAALAVFRPPAAELAAIDDGLGDDRPGAAAGAQADGALPGGVARAPAPGDSTNASGQASGQAAAVRAPSITRVEAWPGRESGRVVVVLDSPAAYRVGDEVAAGGAAPSTFLDLDGVDIGSIPGDIPAQGVFTHIRTAATRTGARVELDLDGHAWRRVFEMREPYRIVVDVARHPPGAPGTGGRPALRAISRVVLDPGHGGSDRGAHGPSGLEEKDVVLDIARRVAPILTAQGIQVFLTRDDDRFVSLEERTARANAFGADLFVSVHCNASEGRGRRGVETYVLDTSRDDIAAQVASRENATTQAVGADLASMLAEMRMADGARRSRRLAKLLLRASSTALQTKYGDAIDGGVHSAGFYVLVGARMPAVLFETGYISNPVDEQRFASAEGRQLLADAIANALRAYHEGR